MSRRRGFAGRSSRRGLDLIAVGLPAGAHRIEDDVAAELEEVALEIDDDILTGVAHAVT